MKALLAQPITGTLKKGIRRLPLRAIHLFFQIRQSYFIWFYCLNRKPRKLFQQNRPRLNEVQERVVRELKESGIAVTHVDEFFPGEDPLPVLVAHAQDLRETAKVQSGKTFLEYLWDRTPLLDLENPFVKLSLSDVVLDTANSYLEMYSHFYFLTLNITRTVKERTPPVISQRWHRDPEDKRMLKLFIYLTDVDEGSGPFTYIPYSTYGLKWAKVFPQQPPIGFYPADGEVERALPKEAVRQCTGRAGTMIFCDTTGLHRGGYATQNERVMFTTGYRTPASVWRADFKHPGDLQEELGRANFREKARFAVQSDSDGISTRLLYWLKRQLQGGRLRACYWATTLAQIADLLPLDIALTI